MTIPVSGNLGRLAGVTLLAGLVGGCVTTADCDPSRTNVFSAAACASTGRAQEREDQKVAWAEGSEAKAGALQQEVQTLRSELKVRQAERQTLSQRQVELDKDMLRLRNVLSRARSIEGVDRQRLEAVQTRMAQLETRRVSMASPSTEAISAMEAEAGAMFDEMDALLGGEG